MTSTEAVTPEDREAYRRDGFVVLRGLLDGAAFNEIELAFAQIIAEEIQEIGCSDWQHKPVMASWLRNRPCRADELYDRMRAAPELRAFCADPRLTEAASALLASPKHRLTDHCRFRMDLPHDTRHLAVWHQDHAYVGGSVDTVTAWVPLQDVDWPMGPLLAIPGSHGGGEQLHSLKLGERISPRLSMAGEYWIRMLPLKRGDVLFFHSLLLHSGQVNLSDRVRYSIQARYAPLGDGAES